jgi:hypothetical protein
MLVWWAFISVWGYGLAQAHLQAQAAGAGRRLWFQTIFFVPFALAAVWLVVEVLRHLYLTLAHRQARVEVSAQPLHPGEEFEVFVSQPGPLRLRCLRVCLVCQEEASYGEDSELPTEKRRAEQIEVLREEAFAIGRGFPYEERRAARVPPRAMHSFEAKHNKVRWLVAVAGDVAGGPSFEQLFPVVVHPAPGRGGGHA